jgi:uncharacterized protein
VNEDICTICGLELPTGDEVSLIRRRFHAGPGPHVAVVAGMRGDSPEGVLALHSLVGFIRQAGLERGTLDFFPCANPVAAYGGSTRWPFFDIDLSRAFPGKPDGHPPDQFAFALLEHLESADLVLELGGPRPPYRELPHARTREDHSSENEIAVHAGLEVVWMRGPGQAPAASFSNQFEKTIRLIGGVGGRRTPGVGEQLAFGVQRILAHLGLCSGPAEAAAIPMVATDAQVPSIRAEIGGLFLASVEVGQFVQQGERVGLLMDPLTGAELTEVVSPVHGRLLSIREQPVVYPGSTLARVVAVPAQNL